MLIWAMFPIIFSIISAKSIIAMRILDGTPTVLIQSRKIIKKNLIKSKFTVNDLLEELRLKDVFNIADVEFAILETSGKMSILRKASSQTATISDLNLPSRDSGLSANVIIDGKLMKENMKLFNVDETGLQTEMKRNNINSVGDILLATYDAHRTIHFYRKNDGQKDFDIFQ